MEFWLKIYWTVSKENSEQAISLCREIMKLMEKGAWWFNTIWPHEDFENYQAFQESIVNEILQKHKDASNIL